MKTCLKPRSSRRGEAHFYLEQFRLRKKFEPPHVGCYELVGQASRLPRIAEGFLQLLVLLTKYWLPIASPRLFCDRDRRDACPAGLLAGFWLQAFVAMASVSSTWAAEPVDIAKLPPPAKLQVDFARDIKPIFESTCFRCHGPERPKSHFSLATRAAALKGGANGVDILPGDSAKSPLIHYVSRLVEDMEMPPPGKGAPLTPEQIGLLRAWIDQGVPWETGGEMTQAVLSIKPTAGWIGVHGNAQAFEEHHWVPRGWNGGAEAFQFQQHFTNGVNVRLDGHALRDDYKLRLDIKKSELGFVRFGFTQYRKYFDDTGGYDPLLVPSAFTLDRAPGLDIGRAWADVGLTLPHWPRVVLGYEYQYKDGTKSTLQWGPVGTIPAHVFGTDVKNIYPAAKDMEERNHILKLDVSHDLKGISLEDNFRVEFYDVKTRRNNTAFYNTDDGNLDRYLLAQDGYDHFQAANTFRLEKQVKNWLLLSGGYLYSRLDGTADAECDHFAHPHGHHGLFVR